jgi:hypothetical protein
MGKTYPIFSVLQSPYLQSPIYLFKISNNLLHGAMNPVHPKGKLKERNLVIKLCQCQVRLLVTPHWLWGLLSLGPITPWPESLCCGHLPHDAIICCPLTWILLYDSFVVFVSLNWDRHHLEELLLSLLFTMEAVFHLPGLWFLTLSWYALSVTSPLPSSTNNSSTQKAD